MMRENANSNSESGSYFSELQEKIKKKTFDAQVEIEKDITRTFPGHPVIDNEEGRDKLKHVLELYARRNKAIGYCQV